MSTPMLEPESTGFTTQGRAHSAQTFSGSSERLS